MQRTFRTFLLAFLMVLTACSTTTGSSRLVQRPSERVSALSIHYIHHSLVAKKPLARDWVNAQLAHEDYDQLGSRIAKLAPPLLNARHMSMTTFYETTAGQPISPDSARTIGNSGFELQISVTQGSITAVRLASTEAEVIFDFSAILQDRKSGAIIWLGAYHTDSIPLSRWHVGFDDRALSTLLARMFDDMAAKGAVVGTPVIIESGQQQSGGTTDNRHSITDVDAVPLIDARGRDGYRAWLYRPSPKAFVIASNGNWRATWGKVPQGEPVDAAERAMQHCQSSGLKDCTLYAVDDKVVWPFASSTQSQPTP
ncbi:hypothetical protein [Paraburkholderia sp. ZP32-5]|uniref:hypothetical protein n=1 Tax=Paraburkholderia sp. ZP32-5 TaxID=2883245 RepID=UPI001F2669B2|nr:hypothetical protein [Paraburkholderia sp. ZP32-5]